MATEKRLIDKEYIIEALELLARYEDGLRQSVILGVVNIIRNTTAVDAAEVVHGRWVNAAGCRTICNHCGEYPLYDYWGKQKLSAYCPNCGAKMDGEREDNG